ncbi:MAG: CotH kinase family protein [Cyclobacteriaceae bacterium]
MMKSHLFLLLMLVSWLVSGQAFTDSNLPIVIIRTTANASIPDEPKIWADMKIVYRGEGQRTALSDQDNPDFIDFEGRIKIEARGSSSSVLPKKQFGFTTYDATEEKDNVKLLGMPKENDWILNGLAFDASLMRDYLCYNLSRQMGQYAPRLEYCELVLNGGYHGVYLLSERVKADDNRININKIDPEDVEGASLTGGYVTKIDRTADNQPAVWTDVSRLGQPLEFIHVTPKSENATPEQDAYIQDQFDQLARTSAAGNSSAVDGYASVIDIPSFIDYMLINELSSNVDAYRLSTYFHKDRLGKLRAGPIWDSNLTFDNDLLFWGLDRSHPDVWQFDNGDNVGSTFWLNLFNDPEFLCLMSKRWAGLTGPNGILSEVKIFELIDQTASLIEEAAQREEQLWGTVGDFQQQVQIIKDFIPVRIDWMTEQLGDFSACSNPTIPSLVISKINYHPASNPFVDDSDLEFIEIVNAGVSDADLTGVYFGGLGLSYQFPVGTSLAQGEALMLANQSSIYQQAYGSEPYGEYARSLSNSSQIISLQDAYGNVIDEVTYSDSLPWPDADGTGFYLSLVDPHSDNSLPENWELEEAAVNLTLGVENKVSGIIYPNPVDSQVFVQLSEKIKSYTFTNLNGKVLFRGKVDSKSLDIDLSHLNAGVYLLKLYTSNGELTQKIVKR